MPVMTIADDTGKGAAARCGCGDSQGITTAASMTTPPPALVGMCLRGDPQEHR
jgi:hypothetical protein